jgi:hypothetical protein
MRVLESLIFEHQLQYIIIIIIIIIIIMLAVILSAVDNTRIWEICN